MARSEVDSKRCFNILRWIFALLSTDLRQLNSANLRQAISRAWDAVSGDLLLKLATLDVRKGFEKWSLRAVEVVSTKF